MMRNEQSGGGARDSKVDDARICSLGDENPGEEVLSDLSPAERLALVAELSARMWELTGRPRPDYPRSEIPVRVTKRR